MAINTAARRFSIANFSDTGPAFAPIPDGTIGAPDRLHLLDLYSGIAADAPVAVTDVTDASFFSPSAMDEAHMKRHAHPRSGSAMGSSMGSAWGFVRALLAPRRPAWR